MWAVMTVYRTGRHLGRTIYQVVGDGPSEHDELIGIMDTPAVGAMVVEALNLANRLVAERRPVDLGGDLEKVPPPGGLCLIDGLHVCFDGSYVEHSPLGRLS